MRASETASHGWEWDCFLAYPSQQRVLAEEVARQLSARLRVFFDRDSLRPGDNWPASIAKALDSALVTLVIVSPETADAVYEQEEVARAIDRARHDPSQCRVIPLYADGVAPSDDCVPYGLKTKQGYTLASRDQLPRIAADVARFVEEAASSERAEPACLAQSIQKHLSAMRVDAEQLTRDQCRIIHYLRHMRRVRVSGSAGSGKTLVAAEKATRLAKAGSRVLFLCHNPLLADYVQQLVAGSGVEVRDFVSWVGELTDGTGGQDLATWTHHQEPVASTLDLAIEQLAAGPARVDAIIVDEGQDFRAEWWRVVEAGLSDPVNGYLYIFHDNNQSLLAHRSDYPVPEPHVDLSRNCRNAGRVLELMRCFDSSTPEAELALRTRGRVNCRLFEPGQETRALCQVLEQLEKDQLIDDTVVLTTGDEPLSASPFARCDVAMSVSTPWQDEVRHQFANVLQLYNRKGVTNPAGGEVLVRSMLDRLSDAALPSQADIELVQQVALEFTIKRSLRLGLESELVLHSGVRSAFRWLLSPQGSGPALLRLRRRNGAVLRAAEILLFFEQAAWAEGLPAQKVLSVRPFHVPRSAAAGTIPLYHVSDFKGLEADAVVLVMRGRVGSHKQATYVGVSRARASLCILVDTLAAATLPRAFKWD